MKRVMQLAVVWLALIALCGCSVVSRQEGKNITLSAEHEALCNSKNTKNKLLCRETMNQLTKFENNVNAYFKEKFHIDGFKLTGIHFPYDGFNHGGFHATFQLESDPYVMITDTFDYRDGKYVIKPSTNESNEIAGQNTVANAIVVSKYFKKISLDTISHDLENLGFTTNNENRLYYGLNSGRYFKKKNLISNSESAVIGLSKEEELTIIKKYEQNKQEDLLSYQEKISSIQIEPLTYAKDEGELNLLYRKYEEYRVSKPEYGNILINGFTFYKDKFEVDERIIYKDINGEIVMSN